MKLNLLRWHSKLIYSDFLFINMSFLNIHKQHQLDLSPQLSDQDPFISNATDYHKQRSILQKKGSILHFRKRKETAELSQNTTRIRRKQINNSRFHTVQ